MGTIRIVKLKKAKKAVNINTTIDLITVILKSFLTATDPAIKNIPHENIINFITKFLNVGCDTICSENKIPKIICVPIMAPNAINIE